MQCLHLSALSRLELLLLQRLMLPPLGLSPLDYFLPKNI